MPWKKGQSGNPNGRAKGNRNHPTDDIRAIARGFVDDPDYRETLRNARSMAPLSSGRNHAVGDSYGRARAWTCQTMAPCRRPSPSTSEAPMPATATRGRRLTVHFPPLRAPNVHCSTPARVLTCGYVTAALARRCSRCIG